MENSIEYDIRGQICPSSLLITLREINGLKTKISRGNVQVKVLTDNRDAIVTIPEAVENMGYGATVLKRKGYYLITIGKV